MKLERMLGILLILWEKKKVTARELAERFEVTERTIYRDMEALQLSGAPIISTFGPDGGFSVIQQSKVDKLTFTSKESELLLTSLSLNEAILGTKQLETLKTKIQFLSQNKIKSNINATHYSNHTSEINQRVHEKLLIIQTALVEKRLLMIYYVSSEGVYTRRKIAPIQLHLQSGSWYLEAYCFTRKANRLFKLTRMERLKITKEHKTIFPKTAATVTRKTERVKLSFKPSCYGNLLDFFLSEDIQKENGTIIVEFRYHQDKNLLPFLLMFGNDVTVKEPNWLINQLEVERKKAANLDS